MAESRPRRRSRARILERRTAYLFLAPSFFALLLFLVLPIFVIVWLSFHDWDLLGPVRFVGLGNYEWLFGNETAWRSLGITALFVLLVIPVQTVLGLFAAIMLNRGLPGSGFFRVLFVVPWICAPLALGLVWRWIFQYSDGVLNTLLGVRIPWLTDPSLALPAVATVTIWQNVGYVTLFFLAGLQSIDRDLLDAAALDGAGAWRRLWSITLPLLRPTTFFVLATGIISSFQVFDTAYSLTPNGGPQGSTDVIAGRIYYEAFKSFSLGHASVLALVLFLVLIALTFAQQRYFAKRTTYEQ